MRLTGAEIIIRLLEMHGIEIVAGIPGGANLPIYNALYKSKIRHVLARHEQGAGFIAHGMARSTGKPAVCFATSGPGVTNLLTAIADAKLDSVPIIAITGQVQRSFIGSDAFQEVDTYGLTLPITKHNFLVRDIKDLSRIILEAFHIAQSGRPGPVVVDVPKDIQMEECEFDNSYKINETHDYNADIYPIEQIADIINRSRRPVLYIGGGIIHSKASKILYTLAKKNSIPVASTLMGLGSFPPDDQLFLGMIGMHGYRSTNYILDESDLLIALGARFDDRATGKVQEFCRHASIIHIDIDHSEVDKIKKSNHSIIGNIKSILELMIPFINTDSRFDWISRINEIKAGNPFLTSRDRDTLNPLNFIKYISSLVEHNTIITTDVGQHQMWTAQAYPFRHPRTLLTSGGLGTMGFGLPAAIGAALSNPDKRIVCISGDGSFMMNIQELATLAELNLNIMVIIMNNKQLGLVRQQQELFYNSNFIASKFIFNPEFAAIGREFGIRSYTINSGTDISYLSEALTYSGPSIVDVLIHPDENVFPMVPPGAANRDMIGGEIYG